MPVAFGPATQMPFEKLPPELRDKVQSISIVFIFSGADIALIPEWIQNWATCYGSKTIVKFDNNGKPLSPPEGYNFNGQLGLMQGIIVTPSGDVWALDLEKSQVVYLPKGDPAKGQLLLQGHSFDPLENPVVLPFHLVIDQQDRIWISNGAADFVTRFPASDPSKVEKFKVGFSQRACR